ncbi:hypothetical protein Dimus_030754, partial [Dionaea muscipula]
PHPHPNPFNHNHRHSPFSSSTLSSPPSKHFSTASSTTIATRAHPSTTIVILLLCTPLSYGISMSNPPPPPAVTTKPQPSEPRKFPAPCWTHEETIALINAYREKWYSLRRRNLRSADWDAVAAEINARCAGQSPTKTSAQCRHKMEKLRKRYRAEKQKVPPFSNRLFSSSWVYFDLMDAMETGSTVPAGSDPNLGAPKGGSSKGGNLDGREMQFGKIDEGFKGKGGFNGELGCSLNEAMDVFGGSSFKKGAVPIKFKLKNHGSSMEYDSNMNMVGPEDEDEEAEEEEEEEEDEGFTGFGNGGYGSNRGFHGKNVRSRSNGFERKNGKSSGGFESRGSNGLWKKPSSSSAAAGGGGGGKRGVDALTSEMVASIKMMGEGFMKMEKMKMDMVREIERMRMEMEMKRSEMILESQQLIVNAFIEGLIEKKKKPKVKPTEDQ